MTPKDQASRVKQEDGSATENVHPLLCHCRMHHHWQTWFQVAVIFCTRLPSLQIICPTNLLLLCRYIWIAMLVRLLRLPQPVVRVVEHDIDPHQQWSIVLAQQGHHQTPMCQWGVLEEQHLLQQHRNWPPLEDEPHSQSSSAQYQSQGGKDHYGYHGEGYYRGCSGCGRDPYEPYDDNME
jgi:hypothetical protein